MQQLYSHLVKIQAGSQVFPGENAGLSAPSVRRQQAANVVQVGLHVFPDVSRWRHSLQLCPTAESDPLDQPDDPGKINLPLAQQMGIVLQMKFADPLPTQPGDLLVDIEPVVERVADIVVDPDRPGL